jgi:integrase
MTFHQLRHMNASVMAALGIPNLYAQERGGWSTDHTLKRVYQHTFSEERMKVDRIVDTFFEDKIKKKTAHKTAHKA